MMPKATTVELYLSGLSSLLSQLDANTDKDTSASLNLWLTRASCGQAAQSDLLGQFCHGLNIESETEALPLAALSHYFYTGASPDYVLYIDPVHLKPDRDQLILFAPKKLQLGLAEAHRLLEEIATCYQDLDWQLECCDASSWVLILASNPHASFSRLSDVIGKSIGNYLPLGPNRNHWLTISNEIQMLLHNHPTNLSREQDGQLTVNSVWFWGGGALQSLQRGTLSPPQHDAVWTDNSCAAGLAKLAGLRLNELPADAGICLSTLSENATQKIFLDLDEWGDVSAEPFSCSQQLKSLQRLWITPLIDALATKQIEQLHLYDDRGRCFSINQKQVKHWWKRVQPVSTFFVMDA